MNTFWFIHGKFKSSIWDIQIDKRGITLSLGYHVFSLIWFDVLKG